MRILYFDCFSGAAGDMVLGALIDAGVPLDEVRRALGSLAISPDTVWTERVTRTGIAATKFCVRGEHPPLDHAHDHDRSHGPDHHDHPGHSHTHAHEEKHHHVHRTLGDISRLIDGSALSGAGKDRAKQLFATLGEAEAAIHGTPLEKVHLHEVGALDSIIDIVGTVFALEHLGVERIVSSPLNVGSGSIRSAHGVYPVPAPATLRLLKNAPVYAGPQNTEMVTPTGALLVTSYADEYGPIPAMRVQQIGYGAGSRDFPDTPNVLRVLVGESDAAAPSHSVVMIEAEIDDMNPQIFGVLMDRLLSQGALDVFYTPIQMKKNRPGTLLSVIAAPALREALTATIFRETTTIGVRFREMTRECLDRETVTVRTSLGEVRIKVARRHGEVLNASAEFDDCARLAAEHDVPAKNVQAMAMQAYLDAKNRGL
ncbi:MAG TPA: nickel pincer cofactor biosynthesis protein LarC [Vicinamibacterales bacterium]|nr:nickel pincer cofactor biosynthesis protein LarC [Vicinamibacterales bacterium]